MKSPLLLALALSLAATAAPASERYGNPPPLVVSPDLSAPWVLQLRAGPNGASNKVVIAPRVLPRAIRKNKPQALGQAPRRGVEPVQTASVVRPEPQVRQMDPRFLPQTVDYSGPQKPGTIVIDTSSKFLYLVEAGGQARRYGVGVGKEGFVWTGTQKISRKAEWPDWRPPAEMIAGERAKGRVLPVHMAGGEDNPLGARAMYLGSTLYRIHGTNAPWTIGGNVSSGCIRMRNEDVSDLYDRVKIGTTVVVQ
ncbi:MAG: L,D-transpeptidase [Phyllobacteriaceae bacterium]|nr:L,D-transpeptidase [Phyllobacteriaceae bacterium]